MECKHKGNRSGHIETLEIGIQGLSGIKQRRVEKCMDCYAIFTEPVTREEWKAELDPETREQISREIEASNVNVFMTTPETIRAHYAAIARGGHEPNQVTKDAIEEARKMK